MVQSLWEYMPGSVYIGTSGFYYEHWKGVFYPPDLAKRRYFAYYVQKFDTVELNSTFYHLPKEKTIQHWNEIAPEYFLFSFKAYRAITHYKKLVDVKEDLYLFLHLLKPIRAKLGIILFQLPPSLHLDIDRLAIFLHILPKGYHYAIEFRHKSWLKEEVYELLRRYDVAFCINDFNKQNTGLIVTSKNVYIRFHGTNGRYGGSYDDATLTMWAERIETLRQKNHTVFCYFNNDFEGYAVQNAMKLRSFLQNKEEK